METKQETPKAPAGRAIYDDMLTQYQYMVACASDDVARAAIKFADSQDPDDRSRYLQARARLHTSEQAKLILTKVGGDLCRLDWRA